MKCLQAHLNLLMNYEIMHVRHMCIYTDIQMNVYNENGVSEAGILLKKTELREKEKKQRRDKRTTERRSLV